jgi:hypothetical protein
LYPGVLTIVQRAKWMNDSWRSVPVSLGNVRVTKKSTGRKNLPHHLIVPKT